MTKHFFLGWIPACAGMTRDFVLGWIPACAGMTRGFVLGWIPACARMTAIKIIIYKYLIILNIIANNPALSR
jgi:hypothetical protein